MTLVNTHCFIVQSFVMYCAALADLYENMCKCIAPVWKSLKWYILLFYYFLLYKRKSSLQTVLSKMLRVRDKGRGEEEDREVSQTSSTPNWFPSHEVERTWSVNVKERSEWEKHWFFTCSLMEAESVVGRNMRISRSSSGCVLMCEA